MSRRLIRIFVIVVVLMLSSTLLLVFSFPWVARTARLDQKLQESIEELGYRLRFKRMDFILLPRPSVDLKKVTLQELESASQVPLLEADSIRIQPHLFQLLLRKIDLSHVGVRGAQIHYPLRDEAGERVKTISLLDSTVHLWNIRSNQPIRYAFRGKWLSDTENINLSGTVQVDFKTLGLDSLETESKVALGLVPFPALTTWWGPIPVFDASGGFISYEGQVLKLKDTTEIQTKGILNLLGFVYQSLEGESKGLPSDYGLALDLTFDFKTGALTLSESALTTPFSESSTIEASFNVYEKILDQVFVRSEDLSLESLPQFVTPIAEMLPINLGFSGKTRFDFLVKGKPELLSLNVRMDLTETTLTYARYFSKPTNVPLSLRADLILVAGQALRGDFTLEFERASMKGSIVGIDFSSGQGEVTILTNKFSVDQGERYFPLIRKFKLSGDAKLLASARGNLYDFADIQLMTNITFDDFSAVSESGAEIKHLNGIIDSGPVDSEVKDLTFELGGSTFSVEAKTFGQPQPRSLVEIRSESVDILELIGALKALGQDSDFEPLVKDWDAVAAMAQTFLHPGEAAQLFETQIGTIDEKILIPNLQFELYGGRISLEAMYDPTQEMPNMTLDLNLERVRLARLAGTPEDPLVEGNLFGRMAIEGQGALGPRWLGQASGTGSFAITNGELHTVDISGRLGQIAELAMLGRSGSGTTKFSDIRGDLKLENGKLVTDEFLFVSDDFHVLGAGDIDLETNLNYRLSVYLSPTLSKRVTPNVTSGARLGPIPLLVVGTLEAPSIRTDPSLFQSFLQHLIQEQFYNITTSLLPSFVGTFPIFGDELQGEITEEVVVPAEGEAPDLTQTLVLGGFNILEQFLSEKTPTPEPEAELSA